MLASAQQDSTTTTNSQPAVRVYTLGGFKVVVRGHALEEQGWRRKTAQKLFKILLSRPSRRIARDEAVELLWPESEPDAASSNFRSTLHVLRTVLDAAAPQKGLGIVFSNRDAIWLRTDVEVWVDADAFEHALEQARSATDALPLLEQADALYEGDYLPDDSYEDWAAPRRESLKQLWAELQVQLAHSLEQHGDLETAVRHLQQLVQADPCNEPATQELIQLFARHGRRSDALRVYQRLIQALRDELDVDPSPASVALARQITRGESPIQNSRAPHFQCSYPFPNPAQLIGRDSELELLKRLLTNGRSAGQAILISAPAGSGKSALVGSIVRKAEAQGVLCLAGGCYEGRGTTPLGPFHDALLDFLLAQPAEQLRAELGVSAPDLSLAIPELRYHLELADDASDAGTRVDRARVFGAVHAFIRSLADRAPTLLCVEDLHAADEATLHLLHYLMRQTRRQRLVLVATFRSDEVTPAHPLAQLQATLVRERLAQRMVLTPLGRDESQRLVSSILNGPIANGVADELFDATSGNPLFLEQLVLALQETGRLQWRGDAWNGVIELQGSPPVIGEVITQRLQRLSSACREVLAVAAVFGQTFDYDVLLAAMDPMEERELLRHLDQAMTASILQETQTGYAFRHALLRETVYWGVSAPRRMLLHSLAGELLERLRSGRVSDYAPELAHHFVHAGESAGVRSKALKYSMLAGRQAANLSSYPEALTYFTRSWELMDLDSSLSDPILRLEAIEGRGWAEAALAKWTETISTFRQALELSDDPVRRARAHGLIAFTLGHTGDIAGRIMECEAGLTELAGIPGAAATTVRLQLQQLIALAWYLRGHYRDVAALGLEMKRESEEVEDPRALVYAHAVAAWGHMGQGQVRDALAEFDQLLRAAELAGDKVQLATAHENLGFQNYLGGRFEPAREHLARSLSLYRDSASELRSVNAQQHLCRVWVANGEHNRAHAQLLQALDLEVHGRDRMAADAYQILGEIHALQSEWELATSRFEQALNVRRSVGDLAGVVESTVALALTKLRVGALDAAVDLVSDAATVADGMDPGPSAVRAYRAKGLVALFVSERDSAKLDLERAYGLANGMPESLEYAPTLLGIAQLRACEDELDVATQIAEMAVDRARPHEAIVQAHTVLAEIHVRQRELARANTHVATAIAMSERMTSPRLVAKAHLVAAFASSSWDSAAAHLEIALSAADTARSPYERAKILHALAKHLQTRQSTSGRAGRMESDATEIFSQLAVNPNHPGSALITLEVC